MLLYVGCAYAAAAAAPQPAASSKHSPLCLSRVPRCSLGLGSLLRGTSACSASDAPLPTLRATSLRRQMHACVSRARAIETSSCDPPKPASPRLTTHLTTSTASAAISPQLFGSLSPPPPARGGDVSTKRRTHTRGAAMLRGSVEPPRPRSSDPDGICPELGAAAAIMDASGRSCRGVQLRECRWAFEPTGSQSENRHTKFKRYGCIRMTPACGAGNL